jgi:endonuclease/exonuclease/phosphatase family metal-dependent hydrolase
LTYARRATQPLAAAAILASLCHAGCRPIAVPVPQSAPIVLAVVTWNIDAGRGDLRALMSGITSGRLTGGRPGSIVFLLQEVAEADVRGIAGPPWTMFLAPVRRDGAQVRGNAILADLSIEGPRVMPLPRERQPRAVALGSVTVGGHSLFVASAHFENRVSWWRGGLLSDTARGRQAEALLQVLPSDRPGILGGDFNTWLGPNEPAWRALARRFPETSDWPRAPTFGDRLVLDHILVDLPDGWRYVRRVLPDRYGSDHHPVLALVFAS